MRRADAEQRQTEERARRLAAIVTCSSDAIVGKTLDGIVTSWNPGAESVYGYSAEEMVGQSVTRVIPPERLEEFQLFLQRLRRGETIHQFETERRRKDGKRISVSITVSPLRDEDGNIAGASTIARDITDRKQAEQKLRKDQPDPAGIECVHGKHDAGEPGSRHVAAGLRCGHRSGRLPDGVGGVRRTGSEQERSAHGPVRDGGRLFADSEHHLGGWGARPRTYGSCRAHGKDGCF